MTLRIIGFCLLLPVLGCSEGSPVRSVELAAPSVPDVDYIESLLTKEPCVGPLTDWQRSYYFRRESGASYPETPLDRSVVEIDLRQAGFEEFKQGRKILKIPPGKPGQRVFDDRQYKLVFAEYDVVKKALSIEHCGHQFLSEDVHSAPTRSTSAPTN